MDPGLYKEILNNLYDGVYLVDHNRKITFWNKAAERITGYTSHEVEGSHCWDDILNHVDEHGVNLCKELCPLVRTLKDGQFREMDAFLLHKGGYRIPVVIRVSPLHDDTGDISGAVEIFSDNSKTAAIKRKLEELESLALLDPVTQVGNRKYAEQNIQARLDSLQRYGQGFGLIFISIDDMHDIISQYGPNTKDRVLNLVARTLMNNVRTFDTLARWDEDDFIALILNITENELKATADRLRALVAQSGFLAGNDLVHVTISVGATLAHQDDSIRTLVRRCQHLLEKSKNSGGNCVNMQQ